MNATQEAALRQALEALEDARHHMSAMGTTTEPQAAAQDAIRAALDAPQGEPVACSEFAAGWRWMSHPTVNNGEPVPVYLFEDDGDRWYRIMSPDNAVDFGWDERDSDWKEVAAPPQRVPQGGADWLKAVCHYISDTLATGTPPERKVARTIMHLLPLDELLDAPTPEGGSNE